MSQKKQRSNGKAPTSPSPPRTPSTPNESPNWGTHRHRQPSPPSGPRYGAKGKGPKNTTGGGYTIDGDHYASDTS